MQARRKLGEAAYFLGEMHRVRDDPQSFAYELSAFLSAARSVDYYLAKQCIGNTVAELWHRGIRERVKNGKFRQIRYFIDKRDGNVHANMIEPRKLVKITVTEIVVAVDQISVIMRDGQGNILERRAEAVAPATPAVQDTATGTRVDAYHFEDRQGEDLFQACQDYLDELSTILTEAEGILHRPVGADNDMGCSAPQILDREANQV